MLSDLRIMPECELSRWIGSKVPMIQTNLNRYEHLDEVGAKMQQFKAENSDFDAFLKAKIDSFLYGDKSFIYKNDIGKVWEEYVASALSSV